MSLFTKKNQCQLRNWIFEPKNGFWDQCVREAGAETKVFLKAKYLLPRYCTRKLSSLLLSMNDLMDFGLGIRCTFHQSVSPSNTNCMTATKLKQKLRCFFTIKWSWCTNSSKSCGFDLERIGGPTKKHLGQKNPWDKKFLGQKVSRSKSPKEKASWQKVPWTISPKVP